MLEPEIEPGNLIQQHPHTDLYKSSSVFDGVQLSFALSFFCADFIVISRKRCKISLYTLPKMYIFFIFLNSHSTFFNHSMQLHTHIICSHMYCYTKL